MKKHSRKKREKRDKNIYEDENKDLNDENYYTKRSKKKKLSKEISFFSSLKKKLIIPILFFVVLLPYIIISLFRMHNKLKEKLNNTRIRLPREEALTKGKEYMDKCRKGLFQNQKFTKSDKPKITAIIPVYNSRDIIKASIASAQNQNMKDIEIILVNDFSTDDSLQVLQSIQTNDPRIHIINNEKNMGILYSRCIGVLEAKGKYILNLDQDDFFFDENLFDSVYEEAEEGNFDIVSFMDLEIRNYDVNISDMKDGPCTHHPDNFIVRQPELPYYPMFKDEHFAYVDIQIWGKIFKTEVYKKAVNLLGKERYSIYNAINEDIIGVFSICIVAESYKYMRRYGLFHLVGHNTAVHRASGEHTAKMAIFFSDIIFDLSKNEYKKYAAIMILGLRTFNDEIKKKLSEFLKKIMNSPYIEEKYKENIRKEYGNMDVIN